MVLLKEPIYDHVMKRIHIEKNMLFFKLFQNNFQLSILKIIK